MNLKVLFLAVAVSAAPAVSAPAEITRTHLNSDQVKKIQSVPVKDSFYFVVLGDSRDGDEVFRYFMNLSQRMDAAFVMDVGDIVHSGLEEQYERMLDMLGEFKIPYITALGNHERHAEGGLDRYKKIFGDLDYYFDYGGVRFVSLDNCSENYEIKDAQIEWLDKALDTDLVKLVFMHTPPETWMWNDSNFTKNSARFMETVEKHDVRKVYVGHKHVYDRFTRGNTEYIITGGGGAPLEPDVDDFYSRDGGSFYHALLVEVKGNRVMDVLIKPTPWELNGFPSPTTGRPMDFAYAGYMSVHSPVIETVEYDPQARAIKVRAASHPRAAARGLKKVTLSCSGGDAAAVEVPLKQDIMDERLFTGGVPAGLSGDVNCAATAVGPAGEKTMEALSADGQWVTVDNDPNESGFGVPPQQDILSVKMASEGDKLHFRIEFAKKPDGGKLSPMRANIYGLAIAPEELVLQDVDDLLKKIPIIAYAPLAQSFGIPECSFIDAASARSGKPTASADGISCKLDGTTLDITVAREKVPAASGDGFKVIAASATIIAKGRFDGEIVDSSTLTTVRFKPHSLAIK